MANITHIKGRLKVGSIATDAYQLPETLGTAGQILRVVDGNLVWTTLVGNGSGLEAVSYDPAPELGGDLNLSGHGLLVESGDDLEITIDDGSFLKLGGLSLSSPFNIVATEVVANESYTYSFGYEATKTATYVDYIYRSVTGWKMGTLFILSDEVDISIVDMGTELATPEIDFTASIVSGDVVVVGTALTTSQPQDLRVTIRQMS